jgi:hypothetical protein
MKLFFSLLILAYLSQASHASKIVIRYESGNIDNAEVIRAIFVDRYSIPKNLVSIRNGHCDEQDQDKRFLNLCVNKKGDLIKISQDIKFKIKSLLSFR